MKTIAHPPQQNLLLAFFGFLGYFFTGVLHLHAWSKTGDVIIDELIDDYTVRRVCLAMGSLAIVQSIVFLWDTMLSFVAVLVRKNDGI